MPSSRFAAVDCAGWNRSTGKEIAMLGLNCLSDLWPSRRAATTSTFRNAASAMLALLMSSSALAATFTVTGTDDLGPGSLRQAILDANAAAGSDVVDFAIPGDGPHRIALASALPTVTDRVLIDGYSQPGTAPNTLPTGWNALIAIEIDCIALVAGEVGLYLATGSAGSTVRGLSIYNVRYLSIRAEADDTVISGNVVGLKSDARTANSIGYFSMSNRGAIAAYRTGAGNGRRIRIGGPAPADRNIVGGSSNGISATSEVAKIEDTVIENNWVGLDGSGGGVVANNSGIWLVNALRAVVRGNVIVAPGSGSDQVGPFQSQGFGLIADQGTLETILEGNRFGVDPSGDGITIGFIPFGLQTGLDLRNSASLDMRVGDPADAGAGNIVGFTRGLNTSILEGIQRVMLSGNRLFGATMAIDVSPVSGPNINDPLDADSGTNGLQNHPELASALTSGATTLVQGNLSSMANTGYRVEFFEATFCPSDGRGHAQRYLGSIDVVTNGNGDAAIGTSLPAVSAGRFLAATATDPLGNTSELGTCAEVDGGPRAGTIGFAATRYRTRENGAPVSLVVRRFGGSDGAVSVEVASEDGNASAGLDYQPISTTLTWADGDSSDRSIPTSIIYDLLTEPLENFNVRLRNPAGGAGFDLVSGTVVTIVDLPDRMFSDDFEL
jgi:hypothetical protein